MAVALSENRQSRYGEAEWQVRVDLAACYRLVALNRMADQIYTHITAAVPGPDRHFLINPYGMMFDEVTASSLIKVDLEGRPQEDSPYEINPAGYVIHSCVHAARHDVKCVLHTHSRAGVGVSCLEEGLRLYDQQSLMFHGRIAYHDFGGFAVDPAEQAQLVADLGDRPVMILRNHGLLTCGRSVQEAWRLAYYLERACQLQLDLYQTGRPLRQPPDAVAEHTAKQWRSGAAGVGTVETREWPALLRMLDRVDPGYRD